MGQGQRRETVHVYDTDTRRTKTETGKLQRRERDGVRGRYKEVRDGYRG